MRRWWSFEGPVLAGLLLSGSACRARFDADIPGELGQSLQRCDALSGDPRDTCAISALERTPGLDAALVEVVCEDVASKWRKVQCEMVLSSRLPMGAVQTDGGAGMQGTQAPAQRTEPTHYGF